jgi:hypothetical protein
MISMIKKLTFVILPLFLHNCSVLSYNDAAVLVKGYTLGYEEDTISKATYDESTASFANVKIGRGRSSTVVLAYVKDDLYEWRSADNVTIYTKRGMIFKITGLKSDVIFSSFDVQDDSLYGVEFESLVSFSDPILYRSIALNTIFKTDQQVIIRTPVGPMLTTKIAHDFNVPKIGWKGRNYYYIDNNGVVVKSEQDIHPFLPRVTIQYFYKYD